MGIQARSGGTRRVTDGGAPRSAPAFRVTLAVVPALALVLALALAACGSATGSPSPSIGPFTGAQVRDCQVVNQAFGEWPEFATPGDMAAAVGALSGELDRGLTVVQYLRPTAVQAEWDAFTEAMARVRPALKADMSPADFQAAYARVRAAGNDLYRACRAVIAWGAANVPQ